jgi:hypothetical protein
MHPIAKRAWLFWGLVATSVAMILVVGRALLYALL